jgi:hypothetical protein
MFQIIEHVTFFARKEWDWTGGVAVPCNFDRRMLCIRFDKLLKVCRTLIELRTALFKFVKMRESSRTRTFGWTSNWTTLMYSVRHVSVAGLHFYFPLLAAHLKCLPNSWSPYSDFLIASPGGKCLGSLHLLSSAITTPLLWCHVVPLSLLMPYYTWPLIQLIIW